jgi:hypothetical protein
MRLFFVLISMSMNKPPSGLFERIISAIKREQEMRKSRKLLFEFLILLIISVVSTPLSFSVLLSQTQDSGILYFISAAVTNFSAFIGAWQDFAMAILEALPVFGILVFSISIGIALFTLRLFLYKKKTLFRYLFNQQLIIN